MSLLARARSLPRATTLILALLLAAYAVEYAASGTASPPPDMLLALGGMNALAVHDGEYFRVLTASLLHGGPRHLVFNGIALLLGGIITEALVGPAWTAVVYTLSALGGSLLGLVLNDASIVSVGASGAIMGLFAASLVLSFLVPKGSARSSLHLRLGQFLVPTLIPQTDRALAGAMDVGKVDYSAHLGGAAAGLACGLVLFLVHRAHPRDQGFALPRTGAGLAVASLLAFVVATFGVVRSYPALAATANLKAEDLLVADDKIPADSRRAEATVLVWGADRLRDPRVRLYRGLKLLDDSPAAAEQELRAGLAEQAILHKFFDRHLEVVLRGALCNALAEQGRHADAEREAQSICHGGGDGGVPDIIASLGVCAP
jgi:rhomboid protease GluP